MASDSEEDEEGFPEYIEPEYIPRGFWGVRKSKKRYKKILEEARMMDDDDGPGDPPEDPADAPAGPPSTIERAADSSDE